MITKFLQENENKEVSLIWGMDSFVGILTYHGRDWWIVCGQAFHINQVSTYGSTCGYHYVVVC